MSISELSKFNMANSNNPKSMTQTNPKSQTHGNLLRIIDNSSVSEINKGEPRMNSENVVDMISDFSKFNKVEPQLNPKNVVEALTEEQ